MREILFRGKRVENGEWVFGSYAFEPKRKGAFGQTISDLDHERHYIVSKKNYEYWEVTPETVGDYTGLKDKNGRRIFEGDIVELHDRNYDIKWRAAVEFGNPNGNYSWGWQLNPIEKADINTEILCWVEMEESGAYCEVIGTIYDNPELLEVEE
jgi:hypothetical protein